MNANNILLCNPYSTKHTEGNGSNGNTTTEEVCPPPSKRIKTARKEPGWLKDYTEWKSSRISVVDILI